MRYCIVVLGLLCSSMGCSHSVESPGPTPAEVDVDGIESTGLSLAKMGDRIELRFQSAAEPRPRMMELQLRWSPGWELSDYAAGTAAIKADKGIVVQPLDETTARVVVFASTNTNPIGNGTVLDFSLANSGATAPGTVEILVTPPMFAPAQSEQGLRIGPPVVFE